tara:strand:- start:598 stop:768 length:171 start_codon:yes stop_codon:yes gene_type:complete
MTNSAFSFCASDSEHDAPLPFEIYTEEELEEMQIEQEQDDWERSIPSPADRNPNLK